GGAAERRRLQSRRRGRAGLSLLGLLDPRRAHLEADRLELTRQLLELLVGEIVLDPEGFELGRLDVPALLRTLEQHARLLAFQQLLQFILSQEWLSPFVLLRRNSQTF